MEFWQAVVVALIPSAAAIIAAFVAFRDYRLRSRLETSKQFLTLFASAHGRPLDREKPIGIGEQVATVHLIADFAKGDKVLENAAKAGLKELSTWSGTGQSDQIATAAKTALERLN